MILPPNCTTRAGRALVTWPKFAAVISALTELDPAPMFGCVGSTPYWVWLKVLNVSRRNWKPTLSVNWNVLARFMSQLLIPGCVKRLRPELPNTPQAPWLKADVLNHWVILLTSFGCPVMSARMGMKGGWKALPWSGAVTENGKPRWKVAITPNCQPPISMTPARPAPLAKRLPRPNGNW